MHNQLIILQKLELQKPRGYFTDGWILAVVLALRVFDGQNGATECLAKKYRVRLK